MIYPIYCGQRDQELYNLYVPTTGKSYAYSMDLLKLACMGSPMETLLIQPRLGSITTPLNTDAWASCPEDHPD